ncbi:uncharacterized protein HD556DRAFT_1433314 [Suillus plorans]|uniref:Uncharacterized protein n=1 Tax=Suillus plorans TaxID=116603 RepID=A0A9P7AJ45_9AGAM|nr:uncharacterized protein HD556DRAFT_1433314 [Suillus plorans]KAG1790547.1 hypothetical protein HD556DRAFT_1433314 [Suillus plorans]
MSLQLTVAGIVFSRSLSDGRDIHIATDGNFHHLGQRILLKRKRPPKKHNHVVLDEAIDQCEHSYKAADGKKQKAAMDYFDDMGVMALICCHDIPLFFANIDSPGEQQKYAVALIEHFYVIMLYDVGCVLSCSLSQYDILPDSVTSCLQFVTTTMHVDTHQTSFVHGHGYS